MIITVMAIYKVRDTDDKRSAGQILFPHDSKMQKLDPTEMLELSGLNQNDPIAPIQEMPTQRSEGQVMRLRPEAHGIQRKPATRRPPKRQQ
jgi:hypothetical protein